MISAQIFRFEIIYSLSPVFIELDSYLKNIVVNYIYVRNLKYKIDVVYYIYRIKSLTQEKDQVNLILIRVCTQFRVK
jgi:hypothetical protein